MNVNNKTNGEILELFCALTALTTPTTHDQIDINNQIGDELYQLLGSKTIINVAEIGGNNNRTFNELCNESKELNNYK